MGKQDPVSDSKKSKNRPSRWVITIFLVTMVISGCITLISDEIMANSNIVVAFLILLIIVLIGILFDVIGMAVATADEKPFHSMAARKVPGAQEAITLLRNAERVSSICNDVVGDICGVVGGSASATVAVALFRATEALPERVMTLIMSAVVAGLTVGGKAIGKTYAINCCTAIVYTVSKILYKLRHLPDAFKKKKRKR